MTFVQATEAMIVSHGQKLQVANPQTFSQENFTSWLAVNIPLMHTVEQSRFNLPAVTARRNAAQNRTLDVDYQEKRVLINDTSFKSIGTSSRNMRQYQTPLASGLNNYRSRASIAGEETGNASTLENTMPSQADLGGSLRKRHKSSLSNYPSNMRHNLNSKSTLGGSAARHAFGASPSHKTLDYGCGDPFYQIKKE